LLDGPSTRVPRDAVVIPIFLRVLGRRRFAVYDASCRSIPSCTGGLFANLGDRLPSRPASRLRTACSIVPRFAAYAVHPIGVMQPLTPGKGRCPGNPVMVRYAHRRHLPFLDNREAACSKRFTRSRFTLHGLLLTLPVVTLACAGTASSSRSSGEEQGTGIIVSSSVTPIRTDSLEYRPQGTPPRRYVAIRATFTNFSSDTVHLHWCRAPSFPVFALEEYSAGAWRDPPGIYGGLTCLDEQVPPLVLAPHGSHTALIELGWFTGAPPGRHLDYLKLSGRTLRIVYTEAYRRPWTGEGRPEPNTKLPREFRVSNAFRVLGEKAR
jgi:hypothetical protein